MTKEELRIVFMGTPEFAVGTLKELVEKGYNVVAVVTQPDRPVGRHQDKVQPSAVKQYAIEQGIPVLQPEKMKDPDFLEALRSYEADLQVVVAFRMLPVSVWSMPHYGTFNVHAALLPQYRGAAPINWAIINGETLTGVTTFFLDQDIDTGRIIMQKPFVIQDDYDVEDVYDGLMRLGAETALKTIDLIADGNGHVDSLPQESMLKSGDTLYPAPKIFKDTCRIHWELKAKKVYDFIRGLSPYPGSWTEIKDANDKVYTLKIYKSQKTGMTAVGEPGTFYVEKDRLYVNTADELLQLLSVQLSGKKRMDARDFVNGLRNIASFRAIC